MSKRTYYSLILFWCSITIVIIQFKRIVTQWQRACRRPQRTVAKLASIVDFSPNWRFSTFFGDKIFEFGDGVFLALLRRDVVGEIGEFFFKGSLKPFPAYIQKSATFFSIFSIQSILWENPSSLETTMRSLYPKNCHSKIS